MVLSEQFESLDVTASGPVQGLPQRPRVIDREVVPRAGSGFGGDADTDCGIDVDQIVTRVGPGEGAELRLGEGGVVGRRAYSASSAEAALLLRRPP